MHDDVYRMVRKINYFYFYLFFKYILHAKLQLSVIAKSDQDLNPDLYGSALVWPPGSRIALSVKKLYPDP